jgi:hypothetical protein
MNAVFASRSFWQPYLTLEPENLSDVELAEQLGALRSDYAIREENISFEVSGEQHTAINRLVEFPFACGERFQLVIEYRPDCDGCEKSLKLVDHQAGMRQEMGWWDLARWHPYCLRPEELELLRRYWRQFDSRWEGSELPLLLLCQFVGLADEQAREALAAQVGLALNVTVQRKPGETQLKAPLYVADGDFRWEQDSEFGWVFTSDEYCCYSIRNRPHAESNEGHFPFTAFREMIREVERQSGRE